MSNYNPSDDRNTAAPSDSAFVSDTVGGTSTYDNAANSSSTGADYNSKQDTAPGYGSGGPSAGYNDNVESTGGEKRGFMDKVKEKLAPNGPGPTRDESDGVKHAFGGPGADSSKMHSGGGSDLNRE